MNKKLLVACLAIMAFAVVPSMASANPILTQPTGTVLAAGKSIVTTNVGSVRMTTELGNLECSTAILEGTLKSNATATGAEGEITNAKFGGTGGKIEGADEPECTGGRFFPNSFTVTPKINLPWCLKAAANADTFTVQGGPCGVPRAIKFNLDVTSLGTCEYSRSSAVSGTLVTHGGGTNENTAAISEQAWTLSGGALGCPSEGKLDMRFSLTSGGSPVFISS